MSKAAELAALIANVNKGSSLANKNLVINGAFTVHQRKAINTTSTENDNYATADRFKPSASNTDNLAITQQVTNSSAPVGFENSYKFVVTTAESALASNELFRIMHFIEGQNLQHLNYGISSAKPVTLSFWVRSSLTGTYAVSMYAGSGAKIIGSTYAISSADTWEKKEITLVGDTAQAITNDNTEGLRLNWILMAGSDYTGDSNASWVSYGSSKLAYGHTAAWGQSTSHDFYLAGVQLEIGEKATEFEHEPYDVTLRKCKRYFLRQLYYGYVCQLQNYATTGAYGTIFPVQGMAGTPSVTTGGSDQNVLAQANSSATGGGGTGGSALTGIAVGGGMNNNSFGGVVRSGGTTVSGASGLVVGDCTVLYTSGSGSHVYFDVDAEL